MAIDFEDHCWRGGVPAETIQVYAPYRRETKVDACSHGLHTVVVEDAAFDRSEISHQVSLFDPHHKCADVMSMAELRGHLR